jgi:alkylhydroperoxidase family enzyme
MTDTGKDVEPARIPPGGFRELGPINWAIAKLGARAIRAPRFGLFNVLGQHRLLFLAWLPYSGMLLGILSKLSVKDAEVVILRVGHLRDCEYELQQHRRLARSRGLGPELQAKIFEGPDAEGLTDRQRTLITATDEFVITRGVSPETWASLSSHLTKAQLIEFCMLAAQYDGLAATMSTLKIPLDFPD